MTRVLSLLCLVLISFPEDSRAQDLGRLFFTPEQRSALDARRKARVPDKPAATPTAESPTTRIDGNVRRSAGRSTVWVNGEAVPEGAQPDSVRVLRQGQNPGRVSISVGEPERQVDLRVGETLDRGSGETRDVLGKGEIKIRPGGAAAKK